MKSNLFPTLICLILASLFSCAISYSQKFNIKEVTDRVFIVSEPDLGNQIALKSEKGYVVFDSFWSEKTAGIFKEEIIRSLGLNDFLYVINMVDRLDMIGGNAAFQEALIVGQENILKKYNREEIVKEEITELIEMWREKEGYSRDRLQNLKEGSEEAIKEESWMNKCKSMADELESSFLLVLPEISFNDKITLNLQDININLFWFGNAGDYKGLSMAIIPDEKLAVISKAIVYPEYHLAPFPYPYYGVLDVPRWIAMLELILEGENPVNYIILSDSYEVYSREQLMGHLEYIRRLWNSVKNLEARGKTLQEIQDQLSLEKDFSFVKEMPIYIKSGDDWIRPQHDMHIRLFYFQGKILASQIIKERGPDSLKSSLEKIKDLGNNVYFDEISIDRVGFELMSGGNVTEAIEVYKLNIDAFPNSSNVYNSLGEAYLKTGDKISAKKNFIKSLDLNPQNFNAKRRLEQL